MTTLDAGLVVAWLGLDGPKSFELFLNFSGLDFAERLSNTNSFAVSCVGATAAAVAGVDTVAAVAGVDAVAAVDAVGKMVHGSSGPW